MYMHVMYTHDTRRYKSYNIIMFMEFHSREAYEGTNSIFISIEVIFFILVWNFVTHFLPTISF